LNLYIVIVDDDDDNDDDDIIINSSLRRNKLSVKQRLKQLQMQRSACWISALIKSHLDTGSWRVVV